MKKKIRPFILIIVLLLLAPVMPGFANDLSVEQVLTLLEKKYQGKSFEARFNQISTLAVLDNTETASGKVWFSHPGKMKWQYLMPEHHEIITNGQDLWIFRPQEKQVMHGSAVQFFTAGAGGAFLSDISLVRKNYTPRIKETTADRITIELISKNPTPDVSAIELHISRTNHEIIQVITRNQYDDTTKFDLYNIQFKPSDPAMFEFTPKDDITIIEMN